MRAVISFHAIDDDPGPLSFPTRLFDRLLGAFGNAGVPVVDLDQLLDSDAPGVALTFDDGMASVHDNALALLRAHGAPAHLFLSTGRVAGDNRWKGQPQSAASYRMCDWNQIERLHRHGVRIESHTTNHPDLRTLSDDQIAAELDQADDDIAARLSRRPRYFAYPYGYHDARVRRLARSRYRACLTTELRFLSEHPASDAVPRLDSHYLRSPFIMRHLHDARGRGYIAIRNAIRRVRGRT